MIAHAEFLSFRKQYFTRVLNIFLSSYIIFLLFQYSLNHVFFLSKYFDLARTSGSYTIFQNKAKRRRIENRNAFNIFSDENINSFSSSSNSLYDSTTTHNRSLQNVTHNANNSFLSKKNRRRRVADFKNKSSLSSSSM